MPLIVAHHLSKKFGSLKVVDDLSFSIDRGEVVGFIGPNGAGKTTTMRLLVGYLLPDNGWVRICGLDVLHRGKQVRGNLGYLPEGAPLYSEMTPKELFHFGAQLYGLDRATARSHQAQMLETLDLTGVFKQKIGTLSKGVHRRVSLALAMLHDPEVLILDEPTDGLDPNQKQSVRTFIREIAEKKAIIISTHVLEEIEQICTRVIVMSDGQLVADAPPGALCMRALNHNAVQLLVTRDHANTLARELRMLKGMRQVELVRAPRADQLWIYAFPRYGKSLIVEIQDFLRRWGEQVQECYVERGDLDAVFRTLTARPAAPPPLS